jgi:hypothetical protein
VSWCSGCKEGSGCGDEERPTVRRRRRSKKVIAKQETVEKEMSNDMIRCI